MSRFSHEHPDDPEGAWDALVDRADLDRKAARENGDPQPRAILDPGFLFDTVRAATKALYPEARIPEAAMADALKLKRGAVLSFVDGSLRVKLDGYGTENGWGEFAFHERQIEFDPEGYALIEIPPSELREMRDFLNKHLPTERVP